MTTRGECQTHKCRNPRCTKTKQAHREQDVRTKKSVLLLWYSAHRGLNEPRCGFSFVRSLHFSRAHKGFPTPPWKNLWNLWDFSNPPLVFQRFCSEPLGRSVLRSEPAAAAPARPASRFGAGQTKTRRIVNPYNSSP